jgi:hypothetical protein
LQTLLLAWSNRGEYGQSPWNGWTQCCRILHGMTGSHPFGWCGDRNRVRRLVM